MCVCFLADAVFPVRPKQPNGNRRCRKFSEFYSASRGLLALPVAVLRLGLFSPRQ